MRYQVINYHDISDKYHGPDMAMIVHTKNHTHIMTRYSNDFSSDNNLIFKRHIVKKSENFIIFISILTNNRYLYDNYLIS